MIETHEVKKPAWIEALVEALVGSIDPHGFVGPIGYRYWEPGNPHAPGQAWQVAAYPTPNEAVSGPLDGCKYVNGFDRHSD